MVEIQENYKDYEAPRCVLKSVKRLIRHTPTRYFSDLQLVHLTNTDALNRKNRRQKTKSRKRKVALNNCAGWYIEKWNNQPARIELIIDKIFYDYPSWALRIGFISTFIKLELRNTRNGRMLLINGEPAMIKRHSRPAVYCVSGQRVRWQSARLS